MIQQSRVCGIKLNGKNIIQLSLLEFYGNHRIIQAKFHTISFKCINHKEHEATTEQYRPPGNYNLLINYDITQDVCVRPQQAIGKISRLSLHKPGSSVEANILRLCRTS